MSPIVKPLTLEHPAGIGSIEFGWNVDRFDHVIQLGQHRIVCQRAAADSAWPESPPLQQLSIEMIDGHEVALGVGCAGTSHWSVSIEPMERGFRFDWACRVKEVPERLGTSYCQNSSVVFEPDDEHADVSSSDGLTRVVPRRPISDVGTYRWSYKVLSDL